MNEQVYGVFNNVPNAEHAIAALKDHGVRGNEVSVIRRSDGIGLPQVERLADHAMTTTSADDVMAGAAKGGAAGLAIGVLAGAVALTVPGIGPILAAGPLWAAFGTVLTATAAGVISGGVVGFLVDQGLPAEAAQRYGDALNRGDILVAVRSNAISNEDARMLFDKYGATDIEEHPTGEISDPVLTNDPPVMDRAVEASALPVQAGYAAPLATPEAVPPVTTEWRERWGGTGPEPAAVPAPAESYDLDEDDTVEPVPASAAGSGLGRIGSGTNP